MNVAMRGEEIIPDSFKRGPSVSPRATDGIGMARAAVTEPEDDNLEDPYSGPDIIEEQEGHQKEDGSGPKTHLFSSSCENNPLGSLANTMNEREQKEINDKDNKTVGMEGNPTTAVITHS
ncbi:predicted protein [Histoplasma capsulatum var. duboisii H88]|uniref:Predicted protein n=1 Tax=Ajellomyces capsulatus (strain H88) TaxID=544711 RepID=F0UHJ7_AJEC8|nr:predicted protein [Histoplasma capsulatum var. duboisii H88]